MNFRRRLAFATSAAMLLQVELATGQGLEPPPALRKNCSSATDECRVCRINQRDGSIVGCSLPGIACWPAAWHCNVPTPDETTEQPVKSLKR